MKKILLLFLFCALQHMVRGGQVEKFSIRSEVLKRSLYYLTVLPDNFGQQKALGKRYPVLYLLHCAGCRAEHWVSPGYRARVDELVDDINFIVVIPNDGDMLSWWLDSPVREKSDYSRFLAEELKPLIDSKYPTISNADNSGLAGHSMGGFGAVHNLIEHPEQFGSAFSIKGTVNLLPYSGRYGLDEALGSQPLQLDNWKKVNILDNACKLADKSVNLGFYSGPNDWFGKGNDSLHKILDSCGIEHIYYQTDEEHFNVPFKQMKSIMLFFDSVFTYEGASLK